MAGQRRLRSAKKPALSPGRRIIDGLKEAVAGNFSRVTIDGQVWERQQPAMKRDLRIRKIMNRCTEAALLSDGTHLVRLKIDHQSFTLTGRLDKREANFFRKNLAIALNRFKHGD